MSEDDVSEASEPTDDDMAALLGEESVPGVILPTGAAVLQMEDNPWKPPKAQETAGCYGQHATAKMADGNVEMGKQRTSLVCEGTSTATAQLPSACVSLDEAILALPQMWQRVYATALYESGDHSGACRITKGKLGLRITAALVERAGKECPAFGQLIADHGKEQDATVFSSIYKGATEGDLAPFNTKEGTEWYRKRSDKAGETWLKAKGLMADQQLTVNHTGTVTVQDADLPAQLASMAALLFGGQEPKAIEGKVVSESDTKEP